MLVQRVVLLYSAFSFSAISSLKVVNFGEAASGTNFSYLMISENSKTQLPAVFILCTSHQQSKMNSQGFYHIYGEDGNPWMMTKFGSGPGDPHHSVGLWGSFGLEWIYFAEIPQPKLFFWYHMCHKVDTLNGLISVSVNGRRLATDVQVGSLKQNKPQVLGGRVVVGKTTKVYHTKDSKDQQFLASASNFNIFRAGNLSIDALSANACNVEGDVLPWSSSLWLTIGAGVKTLDLGKDTLCSGQGRYNLGLPLGLDQQQAVDTCSSLGHGRMTRASSQKELRAFADWFQGLDLALALDQEALPGRCGNIWKSVSQNLTN